MTTLGLIGYPLSHSFSEGYFAEKFAREGLSDQFRYRNFPLETIAEFPDLIESTPDLGGLNVTIPYKEQVIPYLNELSADAKAVGAVNTIKFVGDRLIGYNTDVIGFADSLQQFLQDNGGPSQGALVLGTGGAAKGVSWVLDQMGIPNASVSRTPGRGDLVYEEVDDERMAAVDLLINTTPLGMTPAIDTCPDIPYHCLSKKHRLYDLVYNPAEPLFLRKGKERGAAVINGLAMLHGQAEAAWEIWQAK